MKSFLFSSFILCVVVAVVSDPGETRLKLKECLKKGQFGKVDLVALCSKSGTYEDSKKINLCLWEAAGVVAQPDPNGRVVVNHSNTKNIVCWEGDERKFVYYITDSSPFVSGVIEEDYSAEYVAWRIYLGISYHHIHQEDFRRECIRFANLTYDE